MSVGMSVEGRLLELLVQRDSAASARVLGWIVDGFYPTPMDIDIAWGLRRPVRVNRAAPRRVARPRANMRVATRRRRPRHNCLDHGESSPLTENFSAKLALGVAKPLTAG